MILNDVTSPAETKRCMILTNRWTRSQLQSLLILGKVSVDVGDTVFFMELACIIISKMKRFSLVNKSIEVL